MVGVTVVATSPALQGSMSEITDASGSYFLTNLPPGVYLVTFYYAEARIERKGVEVGVGQTTWVNQKIDPDETSGEVIVIEDKGTSIDPTSTTQGARITQDHMRNVPVPGRTFESALGTAAGSAGDSRGVAFSGSTSLENQYVIDGVNTTGLNFAGVGTPLINEFIEEIQVITGGYQAEFGRATGGVVNVVTKQGSNEFHGTVFTTARPYTVDRTPVREINTSIDGTFDLDYQVDFGFDLGGPIIKDKVWFYVGFAPQLSRSNVKRTIQRQVDCHTVLPDGSLSNCDPAMYQDGSPDEDPETGDLLFQEVDTTNFKTSSSTFQFVSKVNFALSPEHQGQVSLFGAPIFGEGIFGVDGPARATRADFTGLRTDASVKWVSKFNDNKTELEFLGGWHRDKYDQDSIDNALNEVSTTRVFLSTLSRFGQDETAEAMEGCNDSSVPGADPFPQIDNCPVFQYWRDSPGFIIDNLEDRRSAAAKLTQRVEALGTHIVKGGMDVENNRTGDLRKWSGGQYNQLIPDPSFNQVRIYRWVHPGPGGADVCGFDGDGEPRTCDYVDDSQIDGSTLNWAAFLQDSWQIRPNLTLNAGIRYEEQRLRYAKQIRNTIDPFNGDELGKNALTLRNMWAPRLGLIYDWTKEGRSKVFGNWGRFYESIPMGLNDFSFSGDTLYGAFFTFDQCFEGDEPSPDRAGAAPSPYNCPTEINRMTDPAAGESYSGGITVVTPGTQAQYMDEWIVGGEYEVLEDLVVGVTYKNRRLGRVLEDVSTDNAETYVIGNPGTFSKDAENRLIREIEALDEGSAERELLEEELEGYRSLRLYDTPRRDYNALEITARQRFSRNFYMQASYTYSRTKGNYPGLLNGDTGSALPNISTQYDLAELLANRDGPLPQDRPHYLKFDGYYTIDFDQKGAATVGARFRALSGTPIDALASHYVYGFGESYVLPRGSQGRTPFVTNTDIHVGYAVKLARGYELSIFADAINLFNQEQIAVTDELYSFDNVNPIVGGDREDLIFAKQVNQNGTEQTTPAGRNPAFGTPLGRYTPLYLRFGARLTF